MSFIFCPSGDGGHLNQDTGRCIRCLNAPTEIRAPKSPRASEGTVEEKKAPPLEEEARDNDLPDNENWDE
jgi:hypothetical protein